MLDKTGDAPEKIKVVDRRRFTDDGDVRPDWEAPKPSETDGSASPPEVSEPAAEVSGDAAEPSTQTTRDSAPAQSLFLELVNDLTQQAVLFIEGAQGLPAQPAQAQRLIDYLGMLESKTRGNLSAEESQILSNVLFQIRALFVQKNP